MDEAERRGIPVVTVPVDGAAASAQMLAANVRTVLGKDSAVPR